MHCPHCGQEAEGKFCTNCGGRLDSPTPSAEEAPTESASETFVLARDAGATSALTAEELQAMLGAAPGQADAGSTFVGIRGAKLPPAGPPPAPVRTPPPVPAPSSIPEQQPEVVAASTYEAPTYEVPPSPASADEAEPAQASSKRNRMRDKLSQAEHHVKPESMARSAERFAKRPESPEQLGQGFFRKLQTRLMRLIGVSRLP